MTNATHSAVTDAPMKKGGTPVSARPSIQDLTMLKVAEVPFVGKAKGYNLDFIGEGFCKLSASQMNVVLRECHFEHQRRVIKDQVSVLADIMSRGQWRPKDQIDFAALGDRLILVNGYHRANAQVATGKTIEWSIVIHKCQTEDDVRTLYYTYDTNNQARGARQILNGVGFAEENGLTKDFANALFNAVPVIASGFRVGRHARDLLTSRVMDRRLDLASEYVDATQLLQKVINDAPAPVKRKMRNAGTFAVALVTAKYQPEKAIEFWGGAAANDGLRRGDPRQTLVNDMLSRSMNSGSQSQSVVAPTLAWNAFYAGRELRIIKVYDAARIVIAGTPFDGRRA